MRQPVQWILLIPFLTIVFVQGANANPPSKRKLTKEILDYTNQLRARKGLPALQLMDAINDVAENHSRDMARHRVGFGHTGFNSRFTTLRKKIPGSFLMAENVAYGRDSAKEIVDMWKKSPQHRKNMMGNYRYIGIGVATNSSGISYFTQIFIR